MIGLTTHQKKALNIKNSISLTANAGSGKTFVLAQRYLEIILNTDTKISEVAAITFTEKAAGELYKRISDEINKVMTSVDNIQIKQRAEKIRKQIVSAKISTIHSFCIDMLKEFPVEASVDANIIPINAQRTQEIINLSIEKSIKVLLNDPDYQSEVKLLVRLLGSKSTLTRELNSMLQNRNNVLSLISELYSADAEEIAQKYYELFKNNLKIILIQNLPSIVKNVNILNEEVLADNSNNQLGIKVKNLINELNKETDEIKILKLLKELSDQLLTKDGSIRRQNYLNAKLRDRVTDSVLSVERFFEDISKINFSNDHNIIEKELVKYVLAMIKIFDFVLREFENTKSELGVLDFEDILLKTKKLIEIDSVKEMLAGKYKYLLVDEYQDTNEIQYNIFLPLLDDLKRGNLFIVGDEKQSIYRFRDAELQVFARTKSDIQKVSGQDSALTLPDSFRLAPSICFFVNSVFKNLFRESHPFFNEVKSSDLVCARSDNFPGKVEFLISEDEENDEADLVAQRIIRLKSENPERIKNWSDIAVLVRKRASFTDLQNVFIKYHIPYSIVGGTGFYQQQSISDIYNYFSFLLNDKDDASLIGLLRSPFFFVSDAELLELSLFEGENFWEKLKVAANKETQIWKNIFSILSENKNLVNRVSTPQLLRKILSESYFISALSSRVNGLQEISNLNKLITITNDFFTEEFNTLYDYVSYLSDAISNTGDEAQAGIEPGSRGVNILTIHQAKGLEFPAVFLYKCNDYTKIDKVKSRSLAIDKNFGLLIKIPLNENYFGEYHSAPIVGLYDLIESKKDYAEIKRLLYVAMTRAKDFLFISQFNEKTLKKNSFAGLLSEALNLDYEDEYFNLSGELVFLDKEGNIYTNKSKSISLEIPIVKNLQVDEIAVEEEKSDPIQPKYYLSRIKDYSIGEMISATRFSTFYSCPRKYNLMYNYRVSDLVYDSGKYKPSLKRDYLDEYSRNELESYLLDDEKIQTGLSRIKGKLIHYILSKNLKKESLPEFIESRIREIVEERNRKSLKDDIINDLSSYYESKQYQYLNSFKKFRNEYELYLNEGDYYLFGILDKIIFDNSKLIIIDYKTDNIVQNDINEKAELYLPQLKFYAYIISRIFKDVREIECRIIFLKFPESLVVFNYDKSSDKEISKTIKTMINSIRTGDYSLNLGHCRECIFSDENSECIQTIN